MKDVTLPEPLHHTTVEALGLDYAIVDGVPTVYTNDETATLAAIAAHDPLPGVKADKIKELSEKCRETILAGFESSALGSPHWYDGELEDQLNIMGAATSGMDLPFKCYSLDSSGNKVYPKVEVLHTSAQLQQVYVDGVYFKSTQLQKYELLKGTVNAATSIADVESVVWN